MKKKQITKGRYEFTDISDSVKKAIKKYCKEHGILKSRFLAEDKRLKPYL